jgi:hypothetical protein
MPTYSFDVTYSTHDDLKNHVTEIRDIYAPAHHHRIVIAASSRTEAALLAAQMVCCYAICTGVYDRI